MEYAIKIDGRYFKEYIYVDTCYKDRYGGITALGTRLKEGDIVGIYTTETIDRTEVGRSIGNTIATLYSIESIKDKKIEIIPFY